MANKTQAQNKKSTKAQTKQTKRAVKPNKTAKKDKEQKVKGAKPVKELLKPITNKTRHFSIIYEGKKLKATPTGKNLKASTGNKYATPSGKRPKQAAQKALTAIFKMLKAEGKDITKYYNTDIKFVLYENGKRKKNSKGQYVSRRIFRYTGRREELPLSNIPREIITRCDECKKKMDLLQKDNITKKQFNINLKSLKRLESYKKKVEELQKDTSKKQAEKAELLERYEGYIKKFEMDEHLKTHLEEYKSILGCSKCKKETKIIPYNFSNSVKKTPDTELTEEDKKINSDFVEELEQKDKKSRKPQEDKKETKKDVKKETKKDTKKESKKEPKKTETKKKETKKQTPKKK